MKLREYMNTRTGVYSLAESTRTITVDDLDRRVGEQEVEEYLVGIDPEGRQKVHVYSVAPPVHIVTRLTPSSDDLVGTAGQNSSLQAVR